MPEWDDEKEPGLRAKIEAGWDWLLETGEDHPAHQDFFDRWLDALAEYRIRYGEISEVGPVEASKPPEGWDGVVPDWCPSLAACSRLGPCQHARDTGRCWAWREGPIPNARKRPKPTREGQRRLVE